MSNIEHDFNIGEDEALERLSAGEEHLTITVRVDRDAYMSAYANEDYDHFDLCHDAGFTFGHPEDCSAEIIATEGDDFLVRYTTDIRSQI